LVSTMILDMWILMPTLFLIGGSLEVPTQPLRMLRLFKITRMARLMKAFPELVTMIKGLLRALRAISSTMILVGLMVYVWAIMMHMLMKEEDDFNEKWWNESMLGFSTILRCMWTLLMDGTLLLDEAGRLMTELLFSPKTNHFFAGLFFFMYSLLSAMLILQMLIGVLCDVVGQVGQEQRDATAIGLVKQELLGELTKNDDGDNRISQEELFSVMKNPRSKALMRKLNINSVFLFELQKMMFTKPGQLVGIKQILDVMVMCRGDNVATVESMSGGLLSIIGELNDVRQILERDLELLKRDQYKGVQDMRDVLKWDLAKLKSGLEESICGRMELHEKRKVLEGDRDKWKREGTGGQSPSERLLNGHYKMGSEPISSFNGGMITEPTLTFAV